MTNLADGIGKIVKTNLRKLAKNKKERVQVEWEAIGSSEQNDGIARVNYNVTNTSPKKFKLDIQARGQGMWTMEFGKGTGTGIVNTNGYILNFADFKSSSIYKKYLGNPARNSHRRPYYLREKIRIKAEFTRNVTVKRKIKPQTVTYTLKNGTQVTRHIEAREETYTKKFTRHSFARKGPLIKAEEGPPAKYKHESGLVKIYSRPGGYFDLDGVFHNSTAKTVFNIEKTQKKDPVSHEGHGIVTRVFEYDFVRGRKINTLKKNDEASVNHFSEQASNEIAEYVNGILMEITKK